MTRFLILLGKLTSWLSQTLKFGAGVTWAGEVALKLDAGIFSKLIPAGSKVILIAGTNGKTTTTKMICSILEQNPTSKIIHNATGANILNGLVGTLVTQANWLGIVTADYLVLETDEATLSQVVAQIAPDVIVLLNLFRDQLDRYGEVDTIAKRWAQLPNKTHLVVNADDPQLAWIGKNFPGKVSYFGLGNKHYYLAHMQHATDSIFCPRCGHKLSFSGVYFGHLGEYSCPQCRFTHPKNTMAYIGDITTKIVKLEGMYNFYNVLAAKLATQVLGITSPEIIDFEPAFGRQEKLNYQSRNITVLLSKNPTGFNESLRTFLADRSDKQLLLSLNDRIPDGRDVSWIWDVDFENLATLRQPFYISGDRAYDLGLRLKYGGIAPNLLRVHTSLKQAIDHAVQNTNHGGNLWILATYSAMLETRKILTGKKIL